MTEHFQHSLLRSAHSHETYPDEVPTVSIKKASIQSTMASDTLRASSIPATGSVSLLTYLHLSTNVERTTFALTDRSGTFDIFQLGTTDTAQKTTSITQQGNWKQPIHSVLGTFSVYNAGAGSYGAGSFIMAWEMVRK